MKNKEKKPLVSMSWAVKYRPESLDDIHGQDNAVDQIKGMIAKKQLPNALLITGPTGSGKTTLARIIAYTANELPYGTATNDIMEYNIGDERGIDNIRGIAKMAMYKPENNFRIILLDEVHQLLAQSASAMLKPLEEPPSHTVWILCTDKPEKLLSTVVGRCVKITLNQLQPNHVLPLLKKVCKKEKLDFGKKHDIVIKKISNLSNGQPRESLQMLQAVANVVASGGSIKESLEKALKHLQETDNGTLAIRVLTSLYSKNLGGMVRAIRETEDFNGLIYQLLDINRFVIDTTNEVKTYVSNNRSRFLNQLEKREIKYNSKIAIKIHEALVDMKLSMSAYLIEEKDLFITKLAKIITKDN